MAHISQYPPKFDNTVLPFWPAGWDDSEEPVENTMQSEAGTDLIEQVRESKLVASISMRLADRQWVAFFKAYERAESFAFSFYDVETGHYKTKTCRLRNFRKKKVKDSEKLAAVNGIWEISFTITEF